MTIKQQRLLSLGLTSVSVTGTIGTFIFTAKEAPIAKQKMSLIPKEDKKRKIVTFVKSYKKSLIFMGATIVSTIGSKVIGAKTEASLIAAVTMLDASLRKHKDKVKQILGVEADKSIVKNIIKEKYDKTDTEPREGEELFCEEHIGYFYAKPEKIKDAYLELLRDFTGINNYYNCGIDFSGIRTLEDFIKLSEARLLSHTLTQDDLNFGWSIDYLDEWYQNSFINMEVDDAPNEDGARLIYFSETPVWNPELWYDYVHGGINNEEYFGDYRSKHIKNSAEHYSRIKN